MNKFTGAPAAEKFCANHHGWAPAKGGKYVPLADGKHQRWLCAQCIEDRRVRAEARRAAAW